MTTYKTPKEAIDQLIVSVGKTIVLAAPLGAGKANHLLNELYQRAKTDADIQLTILTALTLQIPSVSSFLEAQFLEPFLKRVFKNYPNLAFEKDRLCNQLPANVNIVEFYYKAGQFTHHPYGQKHYLSSNYTHVARDVFNRGVNVICQQVCRGEIDGQEVFSLSSNPDTSIDLINMLKADSRAFVTIAQTNQDLPFMYGESVVGRDYFDILVDNRDLDYAMFAPPKMSVPDPDYMIGLHASSLIKDDGEIQIGIGSLGDALVYSLALRQDNNDQYKEILRALEINDTSFPVLDKEGAQTRFEKGLFAATEMLVDSFAMLYQKGILKKKVYDSVILQRLLNQGLIEEKFDASIFDTLLEHHAISQHLSASDVDFLKEFGIVKPNVQFVDGTLVLDDGLTLKTDIYQFDRSLVLGDKLRNGAVAHAGFFLGPRAFYDFLKELPVAERKLFRMKRISQINHLYGHEEIDYLQRINGRFINTCMKVSLNGAACSDALEDGNQISGVGGQYNFVSMAHELPGARSILQLRSCRVNAKGKVESNIVFNYGNCTIPRHLRDIVITEYGIADLRSKTDQEVAAQLIQIADSRCQSQLIKQAQAANKLPSDFVLDARFTQNLPERYSSILEQYKQKGLFPAFPQGHDFTDEELRIGAALKNLKALSQSKINFIKFVITAMCAPHNKQHFVDELSRMGLDEPVNLKQRFYQKLLLHALCID
ncbi:MAG: acetyl-CoA hydrolase/transferase C-terminal domain-containing protein [Pseudomonadota bacterium]